ncbi:biotin/lipoyl-containing protein, partial [Klebsiella sp. SWET4]|uniref:ATP-binding protein n=1 Tax=Klebsiella sp. SWET4 TaxID=2961620 RepID=UPI0020C8611A
MMGDKITAKQAVKDAGIPVVPGSDGGVSTEEEAFEAADRIGFPVLIKAAAGGGGRGMKVAQTREDLAEAVSTARAEARAAFGDDTVYMERYLQKPRHIELQVIADSHGNVVHLGERDCSLQRRHQKVLEEAPAPLIDEKARAEVLKRCVDACVEIGYRGAGTFEFLYEDGRFYFIEMNTRLQVEHPVTELITGLDLVEQMIRSAWGEALAFKQEDLNINGWAIESRIYAEDPYRKFLPSIGRLVRYDPPAEGDHGAYAIRNDAGVREGDEISMYYDPMISKLCSWAPTRLAAIDGMGRALEDFHIEGLGQNIPFLAAVMDQERFRSGKISTNYIKDEFADGFQGTEPTADQIDILTAVGAAMQRVYATRARSYASGLIGAPRETWTVAIGPHRRRVKVSGDEALAIALLDENRTLTLSDIDWRPGKPVFKARLDGQAFTVQVAPAAEGFDIRHRATKARVLVLTPRSAELHNKLPEKQAADTSKLVLSPMPGLVVSMDVAPGQLVREGEVVCVLEAMKMQNIIRAERDGTVKAVNAKAGDPVA